MNDLDTGNICWGFNKKHKDDLIYYTIPAFEEEGFSKHGFTSRVGGVSPDRFESLNLSVTRELNVKNRVENYNRVASALQVEYGSLTLTNPIHGDSVHIATKQDMGKGVSRGMDLEFCDAMLTSVPNLTVITLHADCVPVFFADRNTRMVGVAHAGWRGAFAQLPQKVASVFKNKYETNLDNLLVGIGPHIKDCCFEVKDDVAKPFSSKFGENTIHVKNGVQAVDLQRVIVQQLMEEGVPSANITCANLCTSCEGELFYSHRRDQGNTGAMGAFIASE